MEATRLITETWESGVEKNRRADVATHVRTHLTVCGARAQTKRRIERVRERATTRREINAATPRRRGGEVARRRDRLPNDAARLPSLAGPVP